MTSVKHRQRPIKRIHLPGYVSCPCYKLLHYILHADNMFSVLHSNVCTYKCFCTPWHHQHEHSMSPLTLVYVCTYFDLHSLHLTLAVLHCATTCLLHACLWPTANFTSLHCLLHTHLSKSKYILWLVSAVREKQNSTLPGFLMSQQRMSES